jgi:hypothetical protein
MAWVQGASSNALFAHGLQPKRAIPGIGMIPLCEVHQTRAAHLHLSSQLRGQVRALVEQSWGGAGFVRPGTVGDGP